MKLTRILLYFSLFTFHFSLLSAQEHLAPLRTNPALVRYVQAAKRAHTPVWRLLSDSIMATLPFIDDFSRPGPYPYDSLWMDNAAFINNTYGICPPTLGVATLDGVNGQGQPYDPSCPIGGSEPADSLTSRPINLSSYKPSDSLYLSFFYQAGGRGFAPQTSDSLLLQFKTNSIPWTTVWYHLGYTPGPTDTSFHSVMILFLDTIHTLSYIDTGNGPPSGTFNPFANNFQFRFKNYACTSANSDQWNIDEVYLNQFRTYNDTAGLSPDVSFVYESPSLLANYQYMPWEQFTDNDLRDTMFIQERSNGSTQPIPMSYRDSIPAAGSAYPTATVLYNGGAHNIYPFYDSGYQDAFAETHIPIKSNFTYTALTGPAEITLIHMMYDIGTDWIKQNDTLRFDQVFSDYYAYDDGTAEASYFINGTPPLQLAYQITLNKADTLRGLQISFNYFVANPASCNFRLAVWDNSGPQGSPGVLRFEDDSIYTPQPSDSLNGFVFYPFHFDKDSAIPAETPFYVGLIQTAGDSINIGYDMNTNHQNQIYYNANIYPPTTGWNTGTYPGSLMMRPVFGKAGSHAPITAEIPDIKNSNESISIYPNPANNSVSLSTSMPANTTLKIYTADGRECLDNNDFSGSLINTSLLAGGFYIVEITPPGSQTYRQKLLIQR